MRTDPSCGLPDTMTAIEIAEPGGPGVLRPCTRPMPVAGPGQILVAVAAAGVNRPDVLQRQGLYPPPKGASDIPGLEIAGSVVGLGEGVSDFHFGDMVAALVPGGGYAEYCIADEGSALPVPKGVSPVEAAALPETVFTVWTNLFERAALRRGETLLVHGGSSGIGTTAIQLATAFGVTVYATAGTAEKCVACEKLGAARAVNYREEDFLAVLREETGGKGVDVILDMVGGSYVQKNIDLLAPDGRLVNIAFLQGSRAEVNLLPVMLKRLTLTGSTLRARPVAEKARLASEVRRHVWPLVESGRVRPVIDSTFPLEEAAKAHERMDSGGHIGKIVLVTQRPGK
jgi:NADPH2:quinone reductase